MNNDIAENIKDIGRSLIDSAEKIAKGLPVYSSNLSLTCYPAENDQQIYINVNYDFIPCTYMERMNSKPKRFMTVDDLMRKE